MQTQQNGQFDVAKAQQSLGEFQQLLIKPASEKHNKSQSLNVSQAQQVLHAFRQLRFPKKQRKSFIEIMKLRFREDVSSRTLAFFLDTTEEHDLDDLVLHALFKALGRDLEYQINSQKVHLEVKTTKGRIDIWVETSEFILVIENKIKHHANSNPFEDYIAYAEDKNKHGKELIFILLGMQKPDIMPAQFQFISHFDLSKHILNDLGRKTLQADQYYLTYLIDYIALIEQDNPNSEYGKMQMDIVDFYRNNREILEQIESEENKSSVYQYYEQELIRIIERLQSEDINIFPDNLQCDYVIDSIASLGRGIDSNHFNFGNFSLQFQLVKTTKCLYFWIEGNKNLKEKDVEGLVMLFRANDIKVIEQDDYKLAIQLLEEPESITAEEAADFIATIVNKIKSLNPDIQK